MSFKVIFLYMVVIISAAVLVYYYDGIYLGLRAKPLPEKPWVLTLSIPNKHTISSNTVSGNNANEVAQLNAAIGDLPIFHPDDQFCPIDMPGNDIYIQIYNKKNLVLEGNANPDGCREITIFVLNGNKVNGLDQRITDDTFWLRTEKILGVVLVQK